jgi:polysaccharide chain length determinant protein (PEP-CTERM system associated)
MTSSRYLHRESSSGFELGLAIWRRRRWIAIVAFAMVFAVAVSLARALPDLYRAKATVLIERQQVSEAFVRPSVTAELETRIQTIRQEIMSRTRVIDLIARFNLYPDLRDRRPVDEIVDRMRKDIQLNPIAVDQVSGRAATIAFTVSYLGRDPQLVAEVANTLAAMYVEENTTVRGRQATRTAEFLGAQLAAIKQEMDAQERLADDFKVRHIGELPQQMEANLASLERLNMQLRLNSENQIRVMERRERLERQLVDPVPAPVAAPVGPTPASELAARRRQLAELSRTYSDEYPDVIVLKAEVAALERQVSDSPRDDRGNASQAEQGRMRLTQSVADIDLELRSLKNEEQALRQAITGYEQRVENSPKRHQEFLELSRGSQAIRERYDTLLKRYEEARLAESLEQGSSVEQFRILDPAIPPHDVAAPNRLRLVLLGAALAVALAIGVALLAERLDTAFHTVDDLRTFTALPVLVSIPRIVTRRETRRRRWRFAFVAVSIAAGLGLLIAGVHHVAHGNEDIVRLMVRT